MADTTPVATVDAPDTAMIPLQDPGSSMSVATAPPSGVEPIGTPGTAMVQQPTQWTPPQPGQVATEQSPQPDAEIAAGAAHQNWLSHILDTVGTILGGDKTIVATKHPDGTVTVEHNPSTTGEKWGRVAEAALGGAARGMAVGQGPGGAGRAFAAGTQAGLAQPQQNLAAANAEAANMNAQQLATAQRALLNQQNTINGWNISHLSRDDQQNQANISLAHAKSLQDMGAIPVAMHVKNGVELAGYGKADPLSVGAHVGINGDMIYNESDGQGGVNFYRIPADVAKQRTTTDDHWTEIKVDPDHPTQILKIEHVTEAGQDINGDRFTKHMAQNVANDAAIKQAQQAKVAQQEADTKATEAGQKAPLIQAQTAAQGAEAALHGAQAHLIQGGSAAGGAGLTGEAYLQAAVDPSMQNQVRATANGDVKMPTASRSPANQAFRNAVMNYDPTFTDARYTGKQEFKTGTESTKLNQLSTGLEHLESAISHADYNPLLPYSDKATAYAEDIKHFTQESGKYIKSGALTQGEYDDLMQKATSVIPSVREAALREKASLLGGKVRASFQQYRAATGQNLPVQEFFDPDTRARLTRYALSPGGAATAPAATAPAATTAAPAAPTGLVTVQIPGQQPGHIPRSALAQFQHDNPNAKVF